MKITGYTIIIIILIILGFTSLYNLEIFLYEQAIKKDRYDDLFGINLVIFIIALAILGTTGTLNKLDKLLKKRIL